MPTFLIKKTKNSVSTWGNKKDNGKENVRFFEQNEGDCIIQSISLESFVFNGFKFCLKTNEKSKPFEKIDKCLIDPKTGKPCFPSESQNQWKSYWCTPSVQDLCRIFNAIDEVEPLPAAFKEHLCSIILGDDFSKKIERELIYSAWKNENEEFKDHEELLGFLRGFEDIKYFVLLAKEYKKAQQFGLAFEVTNEGLKLAEKQEIKGDNSELETLHYLLATIIEHHRRDVCDFLLKSEKQKAEKIKQNNASTTSSSSSLSSSSSSSFSSTTLSVTTMNNTNENEKKEIKEKVDNSNFTSLSSLDEESVQYIILTHYLLAGKRHQDDRSRFFATMVSESVGDVTSLANEVPIEPSSSIAKTLVGLAKYIKNKNNEVKKIDRSSAPSTSPDTSSSSSTLTFSNSSSFSSTSSTSKASNSEFLSSSTPTSTTSDPSSSITTSTSNVTSGM